MKKGIKSFKYNKSIILDLDQLKNLSKKMSAEIEKNEIFLLNGEIGGGKSQFTRFMIRNLIEDENLKVPSPTFLICQSYEYAKLECKINHLDLYRLKSEDELSFLDPISLLQNNINFIEWPSLLVESVTNSENPRFSILQMLFEDVEEDENKRKIDFSTNNQKWIQVIEEK